MKKFKYILLLAVMIASITAVSETFSINGNQALGKGETVTGSKNFKEFRINAPGDFTAITNNTSLDVIVTLADGQRSIIAYLPDNMADLLQISVSGSTLKINTNYSYRIDGKDEPYIHITMPALTGANLQGSGNLNIRGVIDNGSAGFVCNINGSGDFVAGQVKTDATVTLNVNGSGNARLTSVNAKTFDLSVNGSGDAVCDVTAGSVTARTAGSGNIKLTGSATDLSLMTLGSGDINASKLKASHGEAHSIGSGNISCDITDAKISETGSGSVKNRK